MGLSPERKASGNIPRGLNLTLPSYIILGRIEPAAAVTELKSIKLSFGLGGTRKVRCKFQFHGARFAAAAHWHGGVSPQLTSLMLEQLQSYIDCQTFGISRPVLIVPEWIFKNGEPSAFLYGDFVLRDEFENVCNLDDFADRLHGLCVENRELGLAVSDLQRALREVHYANIAAQRAMEAVRNAMKISKNRDDAWNFLRCQLNLSKEFTKQVSEASNGPRHGSRLSQSALAPQEVLLRARFVLYRFVVWKTTASGPLSKIDHPMQ